MRVVFELAYEPVGNRWMIADISVNAVAWSEQEGGGGEEQQGGGGEEQDDTSQLTVPRPKPIQ